MALRNKADGRDHSFGYRHFLVLLLVSAFILISSAKPIDYKIIVNVVEEAKSVVVAVAAAAAEASSLSSFQACPVNSRSLEPKSNKNNLNEAENEHEHEHKHKHKHEHKHEHESFEEPLSYERDEQEVVSSSSSVSASTDTVRFLFAGQSNMVGCSREANATQFIDLINVINEDRYQISSYNLYPSVQEQQLKKEELIQKMKHIIMGGKQVNKEAAHYESTILYDLAGNKKATSVLNNETILRPHPTSTCSFTQPDKTTGNYHIDCERPVTSTACGKTDLRGRKSFGPEFMFGHVFPTLDTMYKDKSIGITKVAVGDTVIEQWIASYDEDLNMDLNDNNTDEHGCNSITSDYWNSIRDAIHTADGTMEAFVWFQGENDHFNQPYPPCNKVREDNTCSNEQNDATKTYGTCETDRDGTFDVCCTPRSGVGKSNKVRTTYRNRRLCDITNPKSDPPPICPQYTPKEKYLHYLTKLVHDVRTEIFKAMMRKNSTTFESKEQIPAVICELGPWIVNGVAKEEIGGSPIVNAQREFVASDQYSVLVNTGSDPEKEKRFTGFYHFDAASVMIIGDRIANALATLLPSSRPTNRPKPTTAVPTNAPPIDVPTDVPTNAPTNAPTDNIFNRPTNSPTNTPTNAPIDVQTDVPTNAPTTSAPTNAPTNAPIIINPPTTPTPLSCIDNPEFKYGGKSSKNCEWLGNRPFKVGKQRCQKAEQDGIKVSELCPFTCGVIFGIGKCKP